MGAGIIVEKQSTLWIGAAADRGFGTLDQEFGARPCDGSEKPLEALLASDVL